MNGAIQLFGFLVCRVRPFSLTSPKLGAHYGLPPTSVSDRNWSSSIDYLPNNNMLTFSVKQLAYQLSSG